MPVGAADGGGGGADPPERHARWGSGGPGGAVEGDPQALETPRLPGIPQVAAEDCHRWTAIMSHLRRGPAWYGGACGTGWLRTERIIRSEPYGTAGRKRSPRAFAWNLSTVSREGDA